MRGGSTFGGNRFNHPEEQSMSKLRNAIAIGVTPIAVATILLATAISAGAAGSSNAVSQFSAKKNPHGQWSYRADGSLLTTSIPKGACGPKKLSAWTNGGSEPNIAAVSANKTSSPIACTSNSTVTVPAGSLSLDPESETNVSVQWTAKKAGTYALSGRFTGNDSRQVTHSVSILHNATSIYTSTISSYGQVDSFSMNVTVAKGDTVSFVVDTGSTWTNLSTGLQATLT
jgi:hypothetical protein